MQTYNIILFSHSERVLAADTANAAATLPYEPGGRALRTCTLHAAALEARPRPLTARERVRTWVTAIRTPS